MNEALEAAIKANAKKSEEAKTPDDAMKYAQAALNMTNALIGVTLNIKK